MGMGEGTMFFSLEAVLPLVTAAIGGEETMKEITDGVGAAFEQMQKGIDPGVAASLESIAIMPEGEDR